MAHLEGGARREQAGQHVVPLVGALVLRVQLGERLVLVGPPLGVAPRPRLGRRRRRRVERAVGAAVPRAEGLLVEDRVGRGLRDRLALGPLERLEDGRVGVGVGGGALLLPPVGAALVAVDDKVALGGLGPHERLDEEARVALRHLEVAVDDEDAGLVQLEVARRRRALEPHRLDLAHHVQKDAQQRDLEEQRLELALAHEARDELEDAVRHGAGQRLEVAEQREVAQHHLLLPGELVHLTVEVELGLLERRVLHLVARVVRVVAARRADLAALDRVAIGVKPVAGALLALPRLASLLEDDAAAVALHLAQHRVCHHGAVGHVRRRHVVRLVRLDELLEQLEHLALIEDVAPQQHGDAHGLLVAVAHHLVEEAEEVAEQPHHHREREPRLLLDKLAAEAERHLEDTHLGERADRAHVERHLSEKVPAVLSPPRRDTEHANDPGIQWGRPRARPR